MKTIAMLLAAAAAATAMGSQEALRSEWNRLGRSHPLAAVEFNVQLPTSNTEALDKAFWEISTPGSARYGQHMTFEEVNKLTATPSDVVENVKGWFADNAGAKCVEAASDGLRCLGRVGGVEKALNTKMFRFLHPDTGKTMHKVDAEYSFPEELKGKVQFITGLNGFPMPHMAVARKAESSWPTTSTSGSGSGSSGSTLTVVPSTLTNMYNVGSLTAEGSTQAAFEFQGLTAFTDSDLSTFISNTGVQSFSISKHYGPFTQNPPQGESTLDVQYLGAVGVGGDNQYYTGNNWMLEMTQDLLSNNAYGIDVVSMSYGWSEAEQCQIDPSSQPCSSGGSSAFVAAVNTNFQKLGAAGVTLLAASGDAGAHGRSDLYCSAGTVHPGYPASSPYVTAVGATQLAAGAKQGGSDPICSSQLQCAISGTEIVSSTSTGSLITSGGGFSLYASRPSYQDSVVKAYLAKSGVTPPTSDFNANGRGYPDVAALGHNYYIELDGQVQSVDGTSAACPVFAGVLSIVNAQRVKAGKSKLGFANPALYQAAAANSAAFTDIVTGNNKCTQNGSGCCSTGFSATAGWDAVTGLGTPNVQELVSAIDTVTGASSDAASLSKIVDMIQEYLAKHQ